MKNPKKIIATILIACLFSGSTLPAIADDKVLEGKDVQLINKSIEAKLYSFKKTKYYTAVEIGFTNTSNQYVEFTPKEMYIDDAVKYSQQLLTMDEIRHIESERPSLALFPTVLGVGLGIAALGTSIANKDNAALGLFMGALSAGGLALLTKGLEERAHQNKLIAIENNTLSDIKRLPPNITLGGVLYFPPTKKPKSITLVCRSKSGGYEKKVFSLASGK